MRSHHSFLVRGLAIILFALFAFSTFDAQTATSSTATQDPAIVDQIWQKASSKYDAERTALLKQVDTADHQGPFRPDWQSLQKYEVPEWYKDAKFGIFIHWGVYSVPAFGNEWYPRNMYQKGSNEYKHHIATYGPQDKFGYKDFIPMFKAEHLESLQRVRVGIEGTGSHSTIQGHGQLANSWKPGSHDLSVSIAEQLPDRCRGEAVDNHRNRPVRNHAAFCQRSTDELHESDHWRSLLWEHTVFLLQGPVSMAGIDFRPMTVHKDGRFVSP